MSVPVLLIALAAAFAVLDIFEARGRSLLGWAVLLITIAIAYGGVRL